MKTRYEKTEDSKVKLALRTVNASPLPYQKQKNHQGDDINIERSDNIISIKKKKLEMLKKKI